MEMKEGDIVLEYQQAKHKQKQIQILADENGCNAYYIKQILVKHGVRNVRLSENERIRMQKESAKAVKAEAIENIGELQEAMKTALTGIVPNDVPRDRRRMPQELLEQAERLMVQYQDILDNLYSAQTETETRIKDLEDKLVNLREFIKETR